MFYVVTATHEWQFPNVNSVRTFLWARSATEHAVVDSTRNRLILDVPPDLAELERLLVQP